MKQANRKIAAILAMVFTLSLLLTACNKSDVGGKGVTQTDMLFNLKNEYIGNASADASILQALEVSKLGKYEIALTTDSKPYALIVNFNEISVPVDELNSQMKMYSFALLALIENADEICWNINTDTVTDNKIVTVEDANDEYNNIKDYGVSADDLHSLLVSIGYYE